MRSYVVALAVASGACSIGVPDGPDGAQIDDSGAGAMAEQADAALSMGPGLIGATGRVSGAEFRPRSVIFGTASGYIFVRTIVDTDHTAVFASDSIEECGSTDVQGRALHIELFENPSVPNSQVTGPGDFQAWLPSLSGGEALPTGNRAVIVLVAHTLKGGMVQVAQSGSVTVTDVTAERLSGAFDVHFEDGQLAGSFEAPKCDSWTRSGSVPTPHHGPSLDGG